MGESHLRIPTPIHVHLPPPEPKKFEVKDILPILAAGIAILYALGWLVQSFSLLQLDLGPFAISKEIAIATGWTSLLPLAAPIFIGILRLAVRKRNDPGFPLLFVVSLAGTLIGYVVLTWMATPQTEVVVDLVLDSRNLTGTLLLVTTLNFLIGTLAAWSLAGPKAGLSEPKKEIREGTQLLAGAVVLLLTTAQLVYFSRFLLPFLEPAYGGYICRDVVVHFTDKTLDGPYNLIAADDKHCVLVPGWYIFKKQQTVVPRRHDRPAGRQALRKVPWDSITRMEEALPGVNGPESGPPVEENPIPVAAPTPQLASTVVTPSTPKQPTAN